MALIRSASEADFTFKVQDFEGELRVVSFTGQEDISRLFQFELNLASEDSEVAYEDMLGKVALLTIAGEAGDRFVNGILWRFEQVGEKERFTSYRAELVPAIALLGERRKCRIFQKKTVKDIIAQILGEGGFTSDQYRFALEGAHPRREYCVQYQESELDFITRLMEEEGMFYFFEHGEDKHVFVMAAGPSAHSPIEEPPTLIFHEPTGEVPSEEHVYSCFCREKIRSGTVMLRDFNHEKPAMNLEVEERGEKDTGLVFYDFPGKYEEASLGKTWAKARLQASEVERMHVEGASTCRRLIPGFLFHLDQHPSDSLNQEYLITGVTHLGEQPGSLEEEADSSKPTYRNELRCIPSKVPFRPLLTVPRPRIPGKQTARVVGPSGEEIYTDDQGRVKVQFHWDREGQLNESSSCWIRVSQGFSGGEYGSFFLPRVGQEVVVSFLEGDPDRPLVTGRVYNGDHPPPYALPGEKTKSVIKTKSHQGEGANEIRFEDKSGSEQFFIHAQKDLDVRVLNDLKETVDKDWHLVVKKACKMNLGTSGLAIEKDDTVKVGGQYSLSVEKDFVEDFKANHKEEVTNEYYLKAQKVFLQAGMEVTLKGSGGFIKVDPAGVTLQGNLVMINSGGAPGVASIASSPASPAAPEGVDPTGSGRDAVYSPVTPVQGQPAVPPPAPPEEEEADHWIEFRFVDSAGNPVGIQYDFTDSGGNLEQDQSAEGGQVSKSGLSAGTCTVALYRILSVEWEPSRIRADEGADLMATVEGFPDGTEASIEIFRRFLETDEDVVATLQGSVTGGEVRATWSYAPQEREAGSCAFVAKVTIRDAWAKTRRPLEVVMPALRNARWSPAEIRAGQSVRMQVDALGLRPDTEVSLTIYRECYDQEDVQVHQASARVSGETIEAAWTCTIDPDDPAALNPENEYYVVAATGDVKAYSDLLHVENTERADRGPEIADGEAQEVEEGWEESPFITYEEGEEGAAEESEDSSEDGGEGGTG